MRTSRTVITLVIVAAVAVLAAAAAQPNDAPADASSLATASFSLHPVDDSGVSGQLQVVEQASGGSLLILTLVGIEEGRTYPAALYVGDCGPDRPVHYELEPVGRENDPFVGITLTTLDFSELTQGDYFVFVFDGDTIDRPDAEGLDVPALACGEVGAGALHGQP